MNSLNQFRLLKQKRFGPFFLTQFLGAFNDNVFKFSLLLLIAFQSQQLADVQSNTLINVSNVLFILPFFLFSATAGQLADKFEKSRLIRIIKLFEIAIMLLAAVAFYLQNITLLIGLLFLLGTQSSFFGPVKYSILPQQLNSRELIGGNALVETGTFLAILTGTILGGKLIGITDNASFYVSMTLLVVAILGYLSSRAIPVSPATDPGLKINWNPLQETWSLLKYAHTDRVIFQSILGISWFWFLGAIYLTQLPNYTRLTLGANTDVVTLLVVMFSIGIGLGSLLCERLSGHRVEIGLVPFGSIGITIFGIDLFFVQTGLSASGLMDTATFIQQFSGWRVIADITLIGMFGGFYIVPLYALIQQRSHESYRSRIIAANNILNALLVALSSVLAIVLLGAGFSIAQLFLVTALLNAAVAVYIYQQVPLFLARFLVWLLIHSVYKLTVIGAERIPDKGPVVLVCNHVSFVDPVIVAGCVPTPTRFVMDHKIFKLPILHFFFKSVHAIAIAPSKEDPAILEEAYRRISVALDHGDIVVLFPEGMITRDGEMNKFRSGIERIIGKNPVPVLPVALRGLWGSNFSRRTGLTLLQRITRLRSRVDLVVGNRIEPEDVTANSLESIVHDLRGPEINS